MINILIIEILKYCKYQQSLFCVSKKFNSLCKKEFECYKNDLLIFYARNSDHLIVKSLLNNYEFDDNIKNKIFNIACTNKDSKIFDLVYNEAFIVNMCHESLMNNLDIVKVLIKRKYYINHYTQCEAVKEGNIEVVKELLKEGLLEVNCNHHCILYYCLSYSYLEILKLLIEHKDFILVEEFLFHVWGDNHDKIIIYLLDNNKIKKMSTLNSLYQRYASQNNLKMKNRIYNEIYKKIFYISTMIIIPVSILLALSIQYIK